MTLRFLFLCALAATALRAAPIKVAVIADSEVLRDAVAKCGAEVVALQGAEFKPMAAAKRADVDELRAKEDVATLLDELCSIVRSHSGGVAARAKANSARAKADRCGA